MTGTPQSPNDNDHFHQTPQPNELGKALNKGLAKAEPYYHLILAVAVAAVVVTGGYVLWKRSTEAQKKLGWDEFALCRAPDDYLAVADKYPDLPVGQWARLHAARQFLGEGIGQSLTNREASDERLNKAKSSYESILKLKVKPELREEALYGLATSLEALSDGDPKEAIKAYEQLLNDYPESQHRLWARERVDALKTKNAEEFYAWFRKQNPKPADRPSPLDIPSNPPEDVFKELQLPTGSNSSQSSTPPAGEMKIELPKPEGESPKSFPEGEEKANMPAPAEQKKPLEVPAESEKTMSEKAPEKPAAENSETKKPESEKPAPTPETPKSKADPDSTPPKGDAEE